MVTGANCLERDSEGAFRCYSVGKQSVREAGEVWGVTHAPFPDP